MYGLAYLRHGPAGGGLKIEQQRGEVLQIVVLGPVIGAGFVLVFQPQFQAEVVGVVQFQHVGQAAEVAKFAQRVESGVAGVLELDALIVAPLPPALDAQLGLRRERFIGDAAPAFVAPAADAAQQVEAVRVVELIPHAAAGRSAVTPVLEVVVVVATLGEIEMLLARPKPVLDQLAVKIVLRGRVLAGGAGVGGMDLPAIGVVLALGGEGGAEVEAVRVARRAVEPQLHVALPAGQDRDAQHVGVAQLLRLGGLSFGLSGFTYWSHDVGGFVQRAPRDLYRRWMAWGALTSHTRAHGAPPREPWEYDEGLTEDFRRALGLKYSLMPYIYAQAKESSKHGFPMLRTLFFEYPNDPGSWEIDDEYMFGSNLLVAPLFESSDTRKVYLPPGAWIDYQSGEVYQSRRDSCGAARQGSFRASTYQSCAKH